MKMRFRTYLIVFSLVWIITLGPSSLAAYDHPVTWADLGAINLGPVLRSQYASSGNLLEPVISEAAFNFTLQDGGSKIHPEFKIPSELLSSVHFWLRIYTEFTTHHVVFFDRKHPDIIYGVLDFRELAKKARNRAAYEITVEKKTKALLHNYQAAFKRLSRHAHKKTSDPFEKQILSAIRNTHHKHPIQEFSKNIGTQTGQRDNIIKGLLAAEIFFPKMEEIFSTLGVPAELTRLSLVESSFNLKAISYAGATGVWQFMPKSGAEYLMINSAFKIDERLSPLKSTVAAAKLLRRNHHILKTWPLAITSYNHGLRNLRNLAAQTTSALQGKYFAPCSKRNPLGWASRNYYAEFLAVLYAEKYRHLFYGEAPGPAAQPIAFFRLPHSETAYSIALRRGVSLFEFRFLNPDIRNIRQRLPRGFWVVLPEHENSGHLLAYEKAKLRDQSR